MLARLAETTRIYPVGLSGQPEVDPPAGDTVCGGLRSREVSMPGKQDPKW